MKLREIAHARSGDKGNTSNIAVFVYDSSNYPMLLRHLTPERVAAHFADRVKGPVVRYELPKLGGVNFVLQEALSGGVTCSLALDVHGKCMSSILLDFELPDE